MAGRSGRQKLIDGLWGGGVIVVILGILGYCSLRSTDDGDNTVAVAAADADSVVADLARASAAQGVCYGWQLQDGSGSTTKTVSSGSNLGVGVKVSGSPDKCPKWVEVRGLYEWFPDSSDSEDYARYTIAVSSGISTSIDPDGLTRLGAGTDKLLNDPAATILDAAEALPLLALEAGIAKAAVPEASATGSPEPVDEGGSDFLRDRWVLLVISGSLVFAALVIAVLGWAFTRKKQVVT